MTPERWERLADLFNALVDRTPEEQAVALAAACPDDPAMRDEVTRMLRSDAQAGSFGDSPAFQFSTPAGFTSPLAEPSLESGDHLARYCVAALVGAGGMGEVYRAHDPQLGRDVAIKVLPRGRGVDDDRLARFSREARAAATLNHPNILTVYDVGTDRGIPYVVSELLEGETLRVRLLRGPLDTDAAARLALQVASGLAAAHDKGIVHRDLKPENLFITRDGIVKILDFGLAKWLVAASDPIPDTTGRDLVMGTAGYMAPEQVRGQEADARADIFSFGALLYEMLTGERAFAGSSATETMHAVLTTDPTAREPVPGALGAIAARCLVKDPALRVASAHALVAELTSAIAPADRTVRRPRAAFASAAVAVLIIGAAIAAPSVLRRQQHPLPGASGRPALAVLPFEDRSGDPDAAWLSTGVPGMLVTALAQTPGLDVIGTERLEASFRELGRVSSDRSARHEAARRAGAGALLVGTLFKVGQQTRLDVQVQDVATGRVVAADTQQGTDLFSVVDGIAKNVRAALDVANRPAGRALREVTTVSLEAYELYEKAQQARHNNRVSDARTLFEEALRIDPTFTLARAQLVNVLERLGESAAALAERGIVRSQIDRLPERQRLLAEAVQEYDANPARAIELLERLLERYPDEEEAYDAIVHAYSHARDPAYWKKSLAFMQRWAKAIRGPGSGHFHNHYGYAYIEHGLFTEAEREFRAYIRVSPDEANGYDSLAELFLLTGRPAMAAEYYDRALRLNPSFGWSHFGRAYAMAAQGRYDDAFAALATVKHLGSRAAMPAVPVYMLDAILRSRVGRDGDATVQLDTARRLARELGDVGAQADADLVDAVLMLDGGRQARAIELADRARAAAARAPVDIMRARRSALAHLIAGIAESRTGRLDAARSRLVAQRQLDISSDPVQLSWRHALTGEIALAEGRLDDAESSFRAAEYPLASSFAIYPALVALGNNLPFRDGPARTALARGELMQAAQFYRRLNQPDVTSKWVSVFEPRYALAASQLAARAGDTSLSRTEHARFLQAWKGNDAWPAASAITASSGSMKDSRTTAGRQPKRP